VIPGAGGTQRLTQLIGPGLARRLVYTGEQVGAAQAERLGIAERVLAPDDVLPLAVRDARAFADGPRRAIAAAKQAIRAALDAPGPGGIRRERELFLDLFGSPDQREGMAAFLEKRAPRFLR
jgi:enoyl-CoA hydratase